MESVAPFAPLLSCYGITEGIGVPVMVRHDDDEWARTDSGGRPFDGIEVTDLLAAWREREGGRGASAA